MKKYFEKQLEESVAISTTQLPLLKGKSLYSNYKAGDKIVYFLFQEYGEIESPYTEPSIRLSIQSVVERELDLMKNDYKYIRTSEVGSSKFPVFEKHRKDL